MPATAIAARAAAGKCCARRTQDKTHIWYEECEACHGSYFDAGEFTDLATLSLSDLFKRFATPQQATDGVLDIRVTMIRFFKRVSCDDASS